MARSLDLSTKRLADVYKADGDDEYVLDVAYSPESDIVFVATSSNNDKNESLDGAFVSSFTRGEYNIWIFVHKSKISSGFETRRLGTPKLQLLPNGTLFVGYLDSPENTENPVHMCQVREKKLQVPCELFKLQKNYVDFDVHVSAGYFLLVTTLVDGFLAAFTIQQSVIAELWNLKLNASLATFVNDILLVHVASNDKMKSFESYLIDGVQLSYQHRLLVFDDRFDLFRWCFVKEKLFAWDRNSKSILIFNAN